MISIQFECTRFCEALFWTPELKLPCVQASLLRICLFLFFRDKLLLIILQYSQIPFDYLKEWQIPAGSIAQSPSCVRHSKTDRQADGRTDGRTDRLTVRQTHSHTHRRNENSGRSKLRPRTSNTTITGLISVFFRIDSNDEFFSSVDSRPIRYEDTITWSTANENSVHWLDS